MEFSPLPYSLVPLRSKYSPQHPILKHPQSTFLPQCALPSVNIIAPPYMTSTRLVPSYFLFTYACGSRWHTPSLLQPLSQVQISNAFNMGCPLCGETNFYPHKMLARHCLYLEVSNTKIHQDTFSNVSVGDEICRKIVTVNLLYVPLRFTKHG